MADNIVINNESCISCGRCVKICPSLVLNQDDNKNTFVNEIANCIACGHCVAVCPTESVIHSEFPKEKIHQIDYTEMPSPDQVMMLCKVRRSNRAFSKKPIPKEMLQKILEAAHRAPTASNLQQVEFTLVRSDNHLQLISNYTMEIFNSVAKKLNNPILKPILKKMMPGVYRYLPVFDRINREKENGNDLVLRNATAVIFIHTPEDNQFGCQDANLAYQNGSLMAEALGVSHFYTGFVCSAIKQDKQNKLAKALGIKGTIHAGMALGLPDFKMINYIDKKEISITEI